MSGFNFNLDYHVRPNVFTWSPEAYKERQEVHGRRQEAQSSFVKAKALIEEGKYVAAEAALETAVVSWPDNPKYLIAMANCISNYLKDPERSLPWFDHAIEMQDKIEYRVQRAQALSTLGLIEDALQDIMSVLAVNSKNGSYLRTRGLLYMRLGLYADAVLDFSAAIGPLKEAGQPILECVFNRAYSQRMLHNSDEALKDFEWALHLAPSNITVKILLGCMYLSKKRYKDAYNMFTAQLVDTPKSCAALNNVAIMLYLLATAGFEEDKQAEHAAAAQHQKDDLLKLSERQSKTFGSRAASKRSLTRSAAAETDETLIAEMGDELDLSDDDDDEGDDEGGADCNHAVQAGGKGKQQQASTSQQQKNEVKRNNENVKQWAVSILQGGALSLSRSDPETGPRVVMLEKSLSMLNEANKSYERLQESGGAPVSSRAYGGTNVHALEVGEAGETSDGLLLMLVPEARVPGNPAVHDRDLQDGELQYNRGLVYLALGQLKPAEEDFKAALNANPSHAHFPHYRAVVHARQNELQEAMDWNIQALSRNPLYFPALYHIGLVLYLLGRNAEAAGRLETAQALQGRQWTVLEARGRVLQELDRQEDAIKALQQALQYLDPEEPPLVAARLHYAIAQGAVATHQPELLRSSLRQARLNGQDAASVYNLRGLLAHKEKKSAKAIVYLTRAIRLANREARFLFDRSQVYMQMKSYPAAVRDMTYALELLPNSASLHYHRAMAFYSLHDEEEALKGFEKARDLMHGSGLKVLRMDSLLWEGSKIIEGVPVPPDLTVSLWYHLGCVHARLGSFKDAVAAFEEAAQLLPSHPVILHELAKSHQATGNILKAVQGFNRVLSLQPKNAHALFRRGVAMKQLGKYEDAAMDVKMAQSWEPGNAALRRPLSSLDTLELCKPGMEAIVLF
ncbi:hypothetical protein CEUSTIGMA_g4203.t1 [Chlamydomonas eustigma]|uniref:UDP-N-acetylglucosamine--peptide N-acetylglucosaminyltransferase SPINDLY n=1 Tax=Chlamydomonas eustigma TaxID=1157962 RepID=A0A250X130_9CHLO|nr:hypothetical protein CEUSTIGMA_g4203.t1 [Chlamydomonas eustigma]|eukprot:GAX76756.1 hypothetical protein CEUSTIGMA_g4203.t1 [Chlamydomonas eustigma]